jgi:hypothetical protein
MTITWFPSSTIITTEADLTVFFRTPIISSMRADSSRSELPNPGVSTTVNSYIKTVMFNNEIGTLRNRIIIKVT